MLRRMGAAAVGLATVVSEALQRVERSSTCRNSPPSIAGASCVTTRGDPERARRAMEAMLKMKKLDVETLRAAADGVPAG